MWFQAECYSAKWHNPANWEVQFGTQFWDDGADEPAVPTKYTTVLVHSHHVCDSETMIALASPSPCSGRIGRVDVDAISGDYGDGNCVETLDRCAALADTNTACSTVVEYHGDSSDGPYGDYPGMCKCVAEGQQCGGKPAAPGHHVPNVYRATTDDEDHADFGRYLKINWSKTVFGGYFKVVKWWKNLWNRGDSERVCLGHCGTQPPLT